MLVVEDGSGLPDADAFVSVEDCDAYCMKHGLSGWTSAPDSPAEIKEAAIRRATAFLSDAFAWKGRRAHGRDQGLAWPRTGVRDAEGHAVPEDEVPVEVVRACCELAAYEAANPGGLTPAVTLSDRVRSEQVGPLRVEYASVPLTAEASRPVLTAVRDLLAGLVSGTGGSLVGTAVRG